MSVFSELMGDIGGQWSRGFAGGAVDDFRRRREDESAMARQRSLADLQLRNQSLLQILKGQKPVDPRLYTVKGSLVDPTGKVIYQAPETQKPQDLPSLLGKPTESAPEGYQWGMERDPKGGQRWKPYPMPKPEKAIATPENPVNLAEWLAEQKAQPYDLRDQEERADYANRAGQLGQMTSVETLRNTRTPYERVPTNVVDRAAYEASQRVLAAGGNSEAAQKAGLDAATSARRKLSEAGAAGQVEGGYNEEARQAKAATAAATSTARYEATLDRPITPAEATLYRVPAGTTKQQLITMSPKPITEADIDAGTQFAAAKAMLKEYRDVSARLLHATDAAGAIGQQMKLEYGYFVRTNEDAVRLRALQATLPLLVRALGEKGTLATMDVQRALNAVPDFRDTRQSSAAKIQQLEKFIATVEGKIRELRPGLERAVPGMGTGSVQPSSSDPLEGRTITNKSTGEKMIRRNGTWQPLK